MSANVRLRAIKAKGLPEDLKGALNDPRVSMRELLSLFNCGSEEPEALMASMQKIGDDLDLLEKLWDLSEASGAALFRLREVANRCGIELPWVSREQVMASFEAQPG